MLLRLLTLPLSAPIAGIRYCLEKVVEVAEKEMWDEEPVREELILANEAFEEGRLSEEDFRARESDLLARLREVRAHHRAMARQQAEERAGAGVDQARHVVIELPDELR